MRRPVTFALFAVALVAAGSSAAALPQGGSGGLTLAKLRDHRIVVPLRPGTGRTTVIVTLGLPPLAAKTGERTVFSTAGRRKLDVTSSSSRTYLARLAAAQERAVATLRREIPEAKVTRRYRVVLDGLAVRLPATKLQRLMRLGFVKDVYPSVSYTLSLNRGPSVIGGPALRAATGTGGNGVKVAVVDDGIDPRHPFLDPAGLSFPAGFPKGVPGFTTPKVVAARAFFPDVSTSESRQPLDESTSFHGTFVAGVIGGVEGTTAPASVLTTCRRSAGGCHGRITGLSGVAPRVHLGNYRVFSQPAPLGGCCSANTPEIIAAFESAVTDGMDVINFSGGGPQSDPTRDPMVAVVTNVVKAGVVPVISAGNDRDLFGLGTVGSPSTAPDAISVAATANGHMFTRGLSLTAPTGLGQMPFVPAPGNIPSAWTSADQQIVDVGTIVGTNGQPVSRQLCSATLPDRSLAGAVALAVRGGCSFELKGGHAAAAGAAGLLLADDRPGDPTAVPLPFGVPGGIISDLDGARIRQALAASGGRGRFRVTADEFAEVSTSWAGVPTSFSSAGLTAFDHKLKPDLAAPGAQIISSTLIEFAGDQYAILDGTSFSAPHVAGAAALLLQRHPSWTPRQVKSALMSTAGPAWGNSTRTAEASVLVEGAGLANLAAADAPLLFTDPQSLSFGDLAVTGGGSSSQLLVSLTDAGGGGGTWQVEVQPQAATPGATVSAPPAVTIPPGGQTTLPVTAAASASATGAEQYGFVVLRRDGVVRRIPYAFSVTRPLLGAAQVTPLARTQVGDTREGQNRARLYRWPTEPFGILSLFGLEQTAIEDGAERVYSIDIPPNTVNFGAVVTEPALDIRAGIRDLLSANAPIHPWLLGSLDENNVQGYGGTPINMNGFMPDFIFNVGAAGAVLPAPGRYYISVDSGRHPFTGRVLARRYVLRSWINDVTPPRIKVLTTRISSGRPTIVAQVSDVKSGVDPLSLLLLYKSEQIGAVRFDPKTGVAVFPIPKDSIALQPGPEFMRIVASDFQETKNVSTPGDEAMPNTRFLGVRFSVVARPAVTWIAPTRASCVAKRAELQVAASSPARISSVGFFDGKRQVARVRKSDQGIFKAIWRTGGAKRGQHTLTAIASDTAGRESQASRIVRVCS
ncbi:MAG TPA: S8 family serine peptidase [Gaiellaceae bacterium]|nr:S8 family serine peptidase [Gaiellaceae bacterium]